ncbi:MAG: dTDP-4-dehydrorhamnose reductase [Hyphomicrobium sp.]|jgi:dTDP-4-dehydrorhamnose reductase
MGATSILVAGSKGQVAQELLKLGTVAGCRVVCLGRPELDIADAGSVRAAFATVKPRAVVNAAAYTAVDKAETDRASAIAANSQGPEYLARECHRAGIPLVHISTDYVFDGSSTKPYLETDRVAPLGVYGASKAAGEAAVREHCPQHLIIRTAWVYSADGQNFLKTMLRLGAERQELSIVDDQIGTPTYARDIARAIGHVLPQLIDRHEPIKWGTYHLTNSGSTTWFGFATEIFRLAAECGLPVPRLKPIPTSGYPTPARRPQYSVLDTSKIEHAFGVRLPPWEASVQDCMRETVGGQGEPRSA